MGHSKSILQPSWRTLGNHIGPLEVLEANMWIFLGFYKGLAGHLPQGGGINPFPWGLVAGSVDLIDGLAPRLHTLRLSTSADFLLNPMIV